MAVGIGAAGIVGVAHEVTAGTFVAAAEFIPVRSESLKFIQDVNYTRPIRGVPDPIHGVEGNGHVEGDIEMEVTIDSLIYLLYGARMDVVAAGAGPYTYDFTPSSAAEAPNKTLSFTVERNGIVFGYVGCVIGGLEISVDNGMLVATINVLGTDEATQTGPTPTWPTDPPLGADKHTISIASSPVSTVDDFSWKLDESAEAVFRLGSLAAAYVKFGERSVEASVTMDFEDKTEYDNYRALTAQELLLESDLDAGNFIHITTHAMIMASYEVGLEGQGDLITAQIDYTGKYDETATEVYNIAMSSDVEVVTI